jgi:hypothetical protein
MLDYEILILNIEKNIRKINILSKILKYFIKDTVTAQHSTAQHSTAQHSTAQHSTAMLGLGFLHSTVSDSKIPF